MRAQILNDVFSLSQANQLKPAQPFELLKYLKKDFEFLTWDTAISRLGYHLNMLEASEIFGQLKVFLLELIEPVYNKLTWTSAPADSWLDR